MRATEIIPTVMVRNEEHYIAQVLRPLNAVFPHIILGDTGSTDATLALARQFSQVEIVEFGPRALADLTQIRQALSSLVQAAGATWELLCDGDELYTVTTLRQMLAQDLDPSVRTGFTHMVTLDVDEAGCFWELADEFSRQALLPVPTRWSGDHPFDVPDSFDYVPGRYYFPKPPPYRYHALHLHRLIRSGQDASVTLRAWKRTRFSLQELAIPRTVPFDMQWWLTQ